MVLVTRENVARLPLSQDEETAKTRDASFESQNVRRSLRRSSSDCCLMSQSNREGNGRMDSMGIIWLEAA